MIAMTMCLFSLHHDHLANYCMISCCPARICMLHPEPACTQNNMLRSVLQNQTACLIHALSQLYHASQKHEHGMMWSLTHEFRTARVHPFSAKGQARAGLPRDPRCKDQKGHIYSELLAKAPTRGLGAEQAVIRSMHLRSCVQAGQQSPGGVGRPKAQSSPGP